MAEVPDIEEEIRKEPEMLNCFGEKLKNKHKEKASEK